MGVRDIAVDGDAAAAVVGVAAHQPGAGARVELDGADPVVQAIAREVRRRPLDAHRRAPEIAPAIEVGGGAAIAAAVVAPVVVASVVGASVVVAAVVGAAVVVAPALVVPAGVVARARGGVDVGRGGRGGAGAGAAQRAGG